MPGASPGFVRGVTCSSGKACTNRWLPERITATAPYGRNLRRCSMFPGVAHWYAFFGLEADSARPRDLSHPIRSFPLWRQLVGILGRLSAPKNKVALFETPGLDLAAMVATQGLLVSSSSYRSLETSFLKEQRVILAQPLLLELVISEHLRRSVYEFRGDNCFRSID